MPTSNLDPIPVASQASKRSSTQCSCLLKSCNRSFTPNHPAQVFCREQCRQFAKACDRKAARKRADDKYRSTENGKEKRRAQATRRRLRINAELQASKTCPTTAARGRYKSTPKKNSKKSLAAEDLGVSDRSSGTQKFLMRNTVALIATTTYERPSQGSEDGLNH